MSTKPTGHSEAVHYTHGEIMVVMGALMLVMLLAALDQTIVGTALPQIARELHGLNELSWVATSYLLTSAVVTPLYGKISDLLGRKKVFLFAIIVFLIGSILCGAAQNMMQLVIFRAIQGIGAGGLMALVFTIVGDVVSPRERGKYMGYFGAVWGLSSVAGPLLGGFLTESLSWRWVFYVNIPLGALALYTVIQKLHLPIHKIEHKIDYLGASLLSLSVVSLLLATVWGGGTYAWASAQIIGLLTSAVVFAGLFVLAERKAQEPIIPLRLFKNDIFTVSSVLSILSGIAMFAAILYIPVYQQLVLGYSPTKSGLMMLPMVAGMLIASIGSGRLISKYGHYKRYPVIGTLLLATGLWMFSHLGLTTSPWLLGLWMFTIGAGLGLFMQVMTLAVQNSVTRRDMGAATATVTFFRSIGGSLGAAIFGAIMVSRLTVHLTELLPKGVGGSIPVSMEGIQSGAVNLHSLPPSVAHDIGLAFVNTFHDMFLIAVPFALLAFVMALFLREAPLRTSHEPIISE
ncbi:MAG: transporter [Candidatus Saccharibacteria bacterium]|nr:transporter [Candidatus Saccharibacteria bacterium]